MYTIEDRNRNAMELDWDRQPTADEAQSVADAWSVWFPEEGPYIVVLQLA